jgi:hypothetical protein
MRRIPKHPGVLASAVLTLLASAASLQAAIITVPTMQPTIAAAIAAAATTDEIRVQNTHVETSSGNAITGIALTIRSYDSSYTTPTAGAQWVLASGGGGTASGLLVLSGGASVTLDGFSQVTVPGGNGIYLGATCSATVTGCTFTGIVLSNTAAIKADAVADVAATVSNCTFSTNGRCIHYNNVTGTTSLNISQSVISGNTSNCVEFRTMAGTHTFNLSDTTVTQATNAPMRLYFFGTTGGNTTNNTVNIDRCTFTPTGTSGALLVIAGTNSGASVSSSADVNVTNSVFDCRSAGATAVGISGLADASLVRKVNVNVRHCTIAINGATQYGVGMQNNNTGSWAVENCIVDGTGTALKNDGVVGTGTVTSGKNLFNTTASTGGTNVAGITLSGTEITGTSPLFVGGSDFHLQTGSPAIDVGTASGVTADREGSARPQGVGPDLGAYEMAPVSAVEGWLIYSW